MFKLSEVANATGVDPRTLTNWLDRRIVEVPAYGSGSQRRFSRDDVVRVALIAELTRLGVSVSEAAHAAATYSDDAGSDRDASELFPSGRTLLIIDADGARVINVDVPREQFESAMAAVYSETRAALVVSVNTVVAQVDAALEAGHAEYRPAAAIFRNGRELHT